MGPVGAVKGSLFLSERRVYSGLVSRSGRTSPLSFTRSGR